MHLKKKEIRIQRITGYLVGAAGLIALFWNAFSYIYQETFEKISTTIGILLCLIGFILLKKAR